MTKRIEEEIKLITENWETILKFLNSSELKKQLLTESHIISSMDYDFTHIFQIQFKAGGNKERIIIGTFEVRAEANLQERKDDEP